MPLSPALLLMSVLGVTQAYPVIWFIPVIKIFIVFGIYMYQLWCSIVKMIKRREIARILIALVSLHTSPSLGLAGLKVVFYIEFLTNKPNLRIFDILCILFLKYKKLIKKLKKLKKLILRVPRKLAFANLDLHLKLNSTTLKALHYYVFSALCKSSILGILLFLIVIIVYIALILYIGLRVSIMLIFMTPVMLNGLNVFLDLLIVFITGNGSPGGFHSMPGGPVSGPLNSGPGPHSPPLGYPAPSDDSDPDRTPRPRKSRLVTTDPDRTPRPVKSILVTADPDRARTVKKVRFVEPDRTPDRTPRPVNARLDAVYTDRRPRILNWRLLPRPIYNHHVDPYSRVMAAEQVRSKTDLLAKRADIMEFRHLIDPKTNVSPGYLARNLPFS